MVLCCVIMLSCYGPGWVQSAGAGVLRSGSVVWKYESCVVCVWSAGWRRVCGAAGLPREARRWAYRRRVGGGGRGAPGALYEQGLI